MMRPPHSSVAVYLITLSMIPGMIGCASWAPRLPGWGTVSKQSGNDKVMPAPFAASDLTPTQSAALCLKTAERMEHGGDYLGAVTFYEQARQLNPSAIDYARKLANLYDQLNLVEQAQREYQQSIAATPHEADLLNDYGVFHMRREQWSEAEVWFRKSLEARPRHERATINLAISLGMRNQLKESFDLFQSQVGAAAANSNLGVLLVRQGRHNEARSHFQQALALDSSLDAARVQLAQLEAKSGKPSSTTDSRPVGVASYVAE